MNYQIVYKLYVYILFRTGNYINIYYNYQIFGVCGDDETIIYRVVIENNV